MNEAWLGFLFIDGLLRPDATLASLAPGSGFRSMADPGTPAPYWIIALQSPGADSITMNGVRLLANPLFQAKVVGPVSMMQQIVDAAERIDALLGGKEGLRNQVVTGGFIGSCYRESPLQNDETQVGELWTNIGGLYRLSIQQST